MKNVRLLGQFANLIELAILFTILMLSLVFQFVFYELPCPLCLLQRVGFIGMGIGLLMNLQFGFRPSHYAITLLSGLFTSFVALRQIALHVIPGTGAYGSAVFGLHLYTWSFIVSIAIIVMTTLLLSIDRQYDSNVKNSKLKGITIYIVFILLTTIVLTNLVAVLLQCGLLPCPDNPSHYLMRG